MSVEPHGAAVFPRSGAAELQAAERLLDGLEHADRSSQSLSVLEDVDQFLTRVSNAVGESNLLSQVHPDAQVRTASEDLARQAFQLRVRFHQSRRIYAALREIEQAGLDDPLARRALLLTLFDMRRAGVELADAERERVRQLRDQLLESEQTFARNLRDDVHHIVLNGPGELEGLPPDFVASHPPQPDGGIRITTEYPDYYPFMQYAVSDSARRKLLHEFYNRGAPANVGVLQRMLELRHELALALGYASWADYMCAERMVGSARAAAAFLKQVADAARAAVRSELDALLSFKRRVDPSAQTIGLWESLYWQEQVRTERFAFDARSARPYFAYDRVQAAVLELNSELFGLEFRRVDDAPSWHASVQTFDTSMDGRPVGRISLDMHPRPAKYKHAACFHLRRGVRGRQLPHVVLVCNFTDPSEATAPALMEHSQVVTFFHEFGHLVHGLARGQVAWARLVDPAERDFLEAPSQLLEEWIFDPLVLRRFAHHYQTGEPIPEQLVHDLQSARAFGRALYAQWLVFRAMISLVLHERDPRQLDSTQFMFELAREYLAYELPPGTHYAASFDHLMGMSATYYTYLWSQAIARDLLTAFNGDLLDQRQARRYRDLVLAPGGTKPAAELVSDFLGRPSSFEALAKWLAA